jgi:hypothetical protein
MGFIQHFLNAGFKSHDFQNIYATRPVNVVMKWKMMVSTVALFKYNFNPKDFEAKHQGDANISPTPGKGIGNNQIRMKRVYYGLSNLMMKLHHIWNKGG